MKTLRKSIQQWFDRLDERWRNLPMKTQHRYTLWFFSGYFLLSVLVIVNVFVSAGRPGREIRIEHIKNPIFKQPNPVGTIMDSSNLNQFK